MTNQERKNRASKIREKRLKQLEIQNKELEKENKSLQNVSKQYPPLILTLLKKLKRIDPWNTVAGLTPINCALITYYKLKQTLKLKSDELRIASNPLHTWVEFNYNDKWWIFDPIAVSNLTLGYPVKQKSSTDKEEYLKLTQYYYNIQDYYDDYDNKIDYTQDEAKIAAMEDSGLRTVLKLNYH